MNLFILDENTKLCAEYHSDQHVMKMAMEATQLACTALAIARGKYYEVPRKTPELTARLGPIKKLCGIEGLYLPTHPGHPCSVWMSLSHENFQWGCQLGMDLFHETLYRFDKTHKSEAILYKAMEYNKLNNIIPNNPMTPYAIAINYERYPTVLREGSAVMIYRDYYRKAKRVFETKGRATWTFRETPEFMYA
jgi:hypothetical protein